MAFIPAHTFGVQAPAASSPRAASPAFLAASTTPIRFSAAVQSSQAVGKRIPDPIYRLFLEALKPVNHDHAGGCSPKEGLCYKLIEEIETGKLESLPLYNDDESIEDVPLAYWIDDPKDPTNPEKKTLVPLPLDQKLENMDKVLTPENMREMFRIQHKTENQKQYVAANRIAETTKKGENSTKKISAKDLKSLEDERKESLNNYRKMSTGINTRVKNLPAAFLFANLYAHEVASENVRYAEYRVSPLGNGIGKDYNGGIEPVLAHVDRGFRFAQKALAQRMRNLDYGLIVLFERQDKPGEEDTKIDKAKKLAQEVVRLKEKGRYNIVGVDLAGDEENNPVTEFKEAFKIIQDYNNKPSTKPENRLGITIHAGETATSKNPHKDISLEGWQSIQEAIRIGGGPNTPIRIGHGLQIINSSQALREAFEIYRNYPKDWERRIDKTKLIEASPLLKDVIEKKVMLEMCPKSNLQTLGIYPGFPEDPVPVPEDEYSQKGYERHPGVFLSRLGVKIGINSDNRTISNTDVTNEFVKLYKYAGLTYADFKRMVMDGFECSFIFDPVKKKQIMDDVKKRFDEIERNPYFIKAIGMMDGNLSLYQQILLLKDKLSQMLLRLKEKLSSFLHGLKLPSFKSAQA